MPDWHKIFKENAVEYDQLVAYEDYEGNILRALNQIRPLNGMDVVEFGAGTGRLTRLIGPCAKSIMAFDISYPMIAVANAKLQRMGLRRWVVSVADNRRLPVGDHTADAAIAGWTFGVFPVWQWDTWQAELGQALGQMRRVLRPGGAAIILETLGTGQETPAPPREELSAYYTWLEKEQGFSSTWIRTDFKFESAAKAASLLGIFFGEAMANRIISENVFIVPECTGIWWVEM